MNGNPDQTNRLRPIAEVAADLGLLPEEIEFYGRDKAKVRLSALDRLPERPDVRYVAVTAITPTPLGEGKTVTTIGLSQALHRLGKKVATCLRQPSQGPTFSIKGGAAGGGKSLVHPSEDMNLHLTGDIHAVGAANNLCAAAIDARIMHERNYDDAAWAKRGLKRLNINPYSVTWKRGIDINDRALREVITGLGGKNNGFPRMTGFEITVASEVMAILALASDLADLRARLGRIAIGDSWDGTPVTAEDLGVAGAMAVLLKDAIKPNLLQTLEGSPVFVHAGPFANIAHGNSSIIADRIASRLVDYVITESGFGADCGMEKLFDIKCRLSGMIPRAVVMVASLRALKMHGGGPAMKPGGKLDPVYSRENPELLEKGLANLEANIAIARLFGVPVVVAVNRFPGDTETELETVRAAAEGFGAKAARVSEVFEKGGEGGEDLARAVVEACEETPSFRLLYPLEAPIEEKIETIATRVYGAAGVEYSETAKKKIALFTARGWIKFPVCMAKTHLSLSHDPELKGAPSGFTIPIRDVIASVGAGFLTPLCGDIMLMPGLPSLPALMRIDLDSSGNVIGLT
ncbi:MAG: formate--tetrahydrofolate ligase [Candidatus Aureabacteria bacterium]|nr:formate--tetrahydrofolate ligase [Candidatus Auribacterota bacterium]